MIWKKYIDFILKAKQNLQEEYIYFYDFYENYNQIVIIISETEIIRKLRTKMDNLTFPSIFLQIKRKYKIYSFFLKTVLIQGIFNKIGEDNRNKAVNASGVLIIKYEINIL